MTPCSVGLEVSPENGFSFCTAYRQQKTVNMWAHLVQGITRLVQAGCRLYTSVHACICMLKSKNLCSAADCMEASDKFDTHAKIT